VITYAIALVLALALPHSELAPLLSIFAPVTAVALTILVTLPHGQRGQRWQASASTYRLGERSFSVVHSGRPEFQRRGGNRRISFPKPGPGLARGVLEALVTTPIYAVVFSR
jgi:hypothetical protein